MTVLSRRAVLGTALGSALASTGLSATAADAAPAVPALAAGTPLSVTTRDGLTLSAMTFGQRGRPELLFVHGAGQSRLSWNRQVAVLAKTYHVVTFDMRGHGASSAPDSIAAYTDGSLWADDIRAVREAAGLGRPTLVGWSFGGMVIGHYLKHHHAADLEGVALVCPVTRFSADLLGPKVPALGALLTSTDVAQRIAGVRQVLDLTFTTRPPAEDAAAMLAYNSMAPKEFQAGYGAIGSEGVDAAWAAPRKLMVTFGAKDQITNYEMSRRVLDLNPRATLSLYRNVGHAPHWDDPARFNRELIRFTAS